MYDERLAAIKHAANELPRLSGGLVPKVLLILGSGLGAVADRIDVTASAPFEALPGFASPSVAGHGGRFVFGALSGQPVMAMTGRLHLYEGHSVDKLVLPIRAARSIGCEILIACNAAGGLREDLSLGQLMMLADHINMLGVTPLTGPNLVQLGERFPAMADAYSQRLRDTAREVAGERGIDLAEGVYAAVHGPSFETMAEIRHLRVIGADAVGMSTVPEVIAARHAGMEVTGISVIANVAGHSGVGHQDVLTTVEKSAPLLADLLAGILSRL